MEDLLKTLKNKVLWAFFWRICGLVALFSMHVLLGRILSPDHYGLYSFTLSIVTVLVLFATMGWPTSLIKLIPQYTVNQQWPFLRGVLLKSHQVSFGSSVFISIVLFCISTFIDDSQRSDAVIYAAMLLPVKSLISLRRSIFLGLHNVAGSIIPDEVLIPILMVIGLLAFGLQSVGAVVLFYFFTSCVVFVLTLLWLWNLLPLELKKTVSAYELKYWAKLTFPLFIGGGAQVVFGQSGVFLLGMFGDMNGAGLFSASFRLAIFVTFMMTAVNIVAMPMMSTAFHNNDIQGLYILNQKSRVWSFVGALPVFLCLLLFPDIILSLFGEKFKEASFLLRVLAFGQLANATVGLAGSLLVVTGEEKFQMQSMVVTMFCCVGGMLLVIPRWGASGVACIYSTGLIFLSIIQFYKANRVVNKRLPESFDSFD